MLRLLIVSLLQISWAQKTYLLCDSKSHDELQTVEMDPSLSSASIQVTEDYLIHHCQYTLTNTYDNTIATSLYFTKLDLEHYWRRF